MTIHQTADLAPFRLDEKIPARDVSFPILAKLIVVIHRNQPIAYRDIVDQPIDEVRSVFQRDGEGLLKRSSRYHYLNALKILDMVVRDGNGYMLSKYGVAIAFSIAANTDSLTQETKRIFQTSIRQCQLIKDNFFALFTGSPTLDPWQDGAPIGLNPIEGERAYEIVCDRWPGRLCLSKEQTQGIIWGLRLWCQKLGLVDEIFIRPQEDIGDDKANIIFPVDYDSNHHKTIEDFDRSLEQLLRLRRPVYGDTVSISVPLLFYRYCPQEQVPLETAKNLLRAWLREKSEHAFVEGPSGTILYSGRHRRGASREVWLKQRRAFLDLEGSWYSRLFVSKSAWEQGWSNADSA